MRGTIELHETVRAAARAMCAEGLSCLMTVDAGVPTGIVTDRDLVLAVLCSWLDPAAPVAAVRRRPLTTAAGSAAAGEAVWAMERTGLRHLPVTDEDGAIVGLVAAEDALALVLRELADRALRTARTAGPLGGRLLAGGDVQTPLPSIAGGDPARAVAERLRTTGADALLVLEDGKAEGIVTQRDLMRQLVAGRRDADQTRARELMSSPLVTGAPEDQLEEIVARMAGHGVRRLVVTGRKPPGVVSLQSLLTGLALEFAARLELAEGSARASAAAGPSSRRERPRASSPATAP